MQIETPPTERRSDKPDGERRGLERSAELARGGWARAEATIGAGEHFLVVLDEITSPLPACPRSAASKTEKA